MEQEDLMENVGLFLAGFNEFEAQTYLLLKMLPQYDLTECALKQHRSETRTRFLQALLRSSEWQDREETSKLLERALKLSKFRNKLSHNPIRVHIYGDVDGDEILDIKHEKSVLVDARRGTPIPQAFNGLERNLEEARDISLALFKLTSAYHIVD